MRHLIPIIFTALFCVAIALPHIVVITHTLNEAAQTLDDATKEITK